MFLGRMSDEELPAFYQASDVFVLPSIARTEAFGVVQIEAMAAGLPVVSTNLPTGVPWVNQDGVSGLVVPPGDAAALGAALHRLAEDERAPAAARRGRAPPRGRRVFARAHAVAAFRNVIDTVVCRAGAPRRRAGGRGERGASEVKMASNAIAKRTLDVVLSGAGVLGLGPSVGGDRRRDQARHARARCFTGRRASARADGSSS